jgi:hypothetical protein
MGLIYGISGCMITFMIIDVAMSIIYVNINNPESVIVATDWIYLYQFTL